MSGLVRREALAFLARWREAGIGLLVLGLGAYGAFAAFGLLWYLALLAMPVGIALIWEGTRRARLPAAGGGAGMVEVDERQITYFAASGGGSISLEALAHVDILTTGDGPFASDLFWCLRGEAGETLHIPSDALGAEALYDALTALPGVDFGAVIGAMGSTEPGRFVIWTSTKSQRRLS